MFYLYKGDRIQFARSNGEVFFCSQCRKECPAESADAFPVAEKILAIYIYIIQNPQEREEARAESETFWKEIKCVFQKIWESLAATFRNIGRRLISFFKWVSGLFRKERVIVEDPSHT